ncbi:MAG TPA: histidine--tRNA ligase [Acidimicrobiia bacterium]|nr:histidine--tRNA ligase [Acidimicrobiia bacterium]
MSFQPPKGTDDIGAPESNIWRDVLRQWEDWVDRYGYPLVMTPLFEATELFERGVGDGSEVVTKQMYTFKDRAGRSVTLRPEGTAGVVRAFLASGWVGPWKGAYSGPMFRYERPQAGRRRQFWQLGVEYLDVEGAVADAEVIELGYRYLDAVQVAGLEVVLNSLGDEVCRPGYVSILREYLSERRDQLCDDSASLIETNPLRVLDCKICAPVLGDAPAMKDHLCQPCAEHYAGVKGSLDRLQIPYAEDGRLVRGLDYYTRTAFEYLSTDLAAAQNAVGGGGRYDGLAESIGGRRAPGVGFALGVDRIVLTSGLASDAVVDVFVVSESTPSDALLAASRLRRDGLRVDFETEDRPVKAQFKTASRLGSRALAVVREGTDLVDARIGSERVELPIGEVSQWLKERL